MSWIKEIDNSEAEGKLREIYKKVKGKRGKLSNVMKAQSLDPEAMQAHLDLYLTLMFRLEGNVTREQRELIGTVVSVVNSCTYCIEHHAEALDFYWKDKDKINRLVENPESIDLDPKDRALVDYAVKLTKSPSVTLETDIEILREAGFNDEDILRINMLVGYFNFVNRIVLGLGIELSPEEVGGYKY